MRERNDSPGFPGQAGWGAAAKSIPASFDEENAGRLADRFGKDPGEVRDPK